MGSGTSTSSSNRYPFRMRRWERPSLGFGFAILHVLDKHTIHYALNILEKEAARRLPYRNLSSSMAKSGSDLVPAVNGRVDVNQHRLGHWLWQSKIGNPYSQRHQNQRFIHELKWGVQRSIAG